MSAAIADQVEANIKGQAEADRALDLVHKGIAHPDAVHVCAMQVWADHGTPGLIGFHRRLQKRLERAS